MSIILGIDPGSRVTGFGIIERIDHSKGNINDQSFRTLSYGVIRMNERQPFAMRMKELGQGLREILQTFKPQEVAIEKIFLGRSADSAFKLGHARGVAMYEAAVFGCPVFEYATRLVKKGLTGKGSSSKEEVQVFVQRWLALPPIKRLDASDALSLALYHGSQAQLLRNFKNQEIDL